MKIGNALGRVQEQGKYTDMPSQAPPICDSGTS